MSLDGAPRPAGGPPPQAVTQPVAAPLSAAAIFLVATLRPGQASDAAARALCGNLGGLLRAVGFRDLDAGLTCVMGLGAELWDRLAGPERPAGLHPFREIQAGDRLVTSGIDGTYPVGLAVAQVVSVERETGQIFARVTCRPLAGVDKSPHVLILGPVAALPRRPEEAADTNPPRKGRNRIRD